MTIAVTVLASRANAQRAIEDPFRTALRSLVPEDVNLPPHLFDTLDHFTHEMGRALREEDTRVVWLLDASPSLRSRRETIARMIPPIIRTARLMGTRDLETVVMAYGAESRVILHVEETGNDTVLKQLANAFRDVPAEDSGKENVFAALLHAADRFAVQARDPQQRVLFFVLTDEPGDDAEYLEEAIGRLKDAGVHCSIAGHQTPFLSRQHFIEWVYADGFSEEIAIYAGLETAVPQRVLELPLSPVDPREIPSGFGPWPLVRLCAETGGRYLADRSEYEGSFDVDSLAKYAPDTRRSAAEIESETESHPALRALAQAARTLDDAALSDVPRAFIPGERPIVELLLSAQKNAAVKEYYVNAAWQSLQPFAQRRDVFSEPRWRADFDLSIARVRAAHVRLLTYNQSLARMRASPHGLEDDNDTWQLEPAPVTAAGPELEHAIRSAESDLRRVIDDHPGTPWSAVAERELAAPWGWEWEQTKAE